MTYSTLSIGCWGLFISIVLIMKILAIVWSTNFPSVYSSYEQVLIDFATQASMYWWTIVRTSNIYYDIFHKTFSKMWIRDGTWYVQTNLKPTHIYFLFNHFDYSLIDICYNYPASTSAMLCSIAKDKYATYKLFSDYSPLTYKLTHIQKDPLIIDLFEDTQFVLKPIYGAQWVWVSLVDRNQLEKICFDWHFHSYNDFIVQKFIDTSTGIPWVVDGIHDVRLVVFGKKIAYVLIRVASDGDFRCNIAQDGWFHFVDFSDLPLNMQETWLHIIDKLSPIIWDGSYTYSVDLAYASNKKTYLVELNSAIWLKHLTYSPLHKNIFLEHLFTMFSIG